MAKAKTQTKTYANSRERDKDVPRMAKQGYTVQSMVPEGGSFKKGKAALLGIGGALLVFPVGLLAAGLAGKKDTAWHVVYRLED